jgi:Zn-dependent protease with chaperone function
MSAVGEAAGPRPNPFAMPSATAVRFALLAIATSTAIFIWGGAVLSTLIVPPSPTDSAYYACIDRYWDNVAHRGGNADPSALGTYTGDLSSSNCGPHSSVSRWPNFAVLAFFWLIVLVLYWWMPAWRLRRRKLRPLPFDEIPALSSYLAELRRLAGVTEEVTFVTNYLDPGVSGLAFGRLGRRYVMLSAGMLALFDRDRPAFRAIVLHELAHLRNRDVDIAFITIAVSRIYLVVIVLPIVANALDLLTGAVHGYALAFTATLIWYLVFLAVVVPLIRNSLLRSRELHADARAALWDKASDGLSRLFSQQRRWRGGWLSHLLAVHPFPSDRIMALTDTRSLLAISFGEALTMGLTISLGLDLRDVLGFGSVPIIYTFWATLLALGMGFSVWRDAINGYVTDSSTKVNMAGFGLGIGLAAGIMSPMEVTWFEDPGRPIVSYVVGIILPWCAMLVVGSWLFVRWMAIATRSWLPVAASTKRPVVVITASLVASAALLIAFFNYALPLAEQAAVIQTGTLHGWPQAIAFLTNAVLRAIAEPRALVIIVLLGLAVYPLAGVVLARRLRVTSWASWLTIDPVSTGWRPHAQLTPRFAVVKTGIITALSGLVLIFTCYLVGGLAAPTTLSAAVEAHLTHAVVIVLEVIAAIIATARARDLRVLYGIIAAFIAGVVVAIGERIAMQITICTMAIAHNMSCTSVMSRFLSTLDIIFYDFVWGLELAFLAALLTAAVTRRRLQENSAATPSRGPGSPGEISNGFA